MYLVTFIDLCRSLNMPQLCVIVIVSKNYSHIYILAIRPPKTFLIK